MRNMRGGKKLLALMRRRSQRVGTIHLRLTLDARHIHRAQAGDRGDHALGEMVMAGPRIGEEDHLSGVTGLFPRRIAE